MRRGHPSKTRMRLCREAARLMYEEEVGQYFTAKRMAAKRLFGQGGQKRLRFRPRDLPSNGEIQAAVLALACEREGDARLDRLDAMRRVALGVMEALSEFEPRLIGSVATGHIRLGSDIDIQLFSDDPDAPEARLIALDWAYERQDVVVRRPEGIVEYQHLHLDGPDPIELSVYDRMALRRRPRSSTDGLPMLRLTARELAALCGPTR